MRPRRPHPVEHTGRINVTPLIDVVMCLIIFYLLVGRLAMDKQGGVQLPGSSVGKEAAARESLVINVLAAPAPGAAVSTVIDGVSCTAEQLLTRLRLHAGSDPAASPPVQVRADRRLPYSSISPILGACREAGLRSVLLTTQRERGAPAEAP